MKGRNDMIMGRAWMFCILLLLQVALAGKAYSQDLIKEVLKVTALIDKKQDKEAESILDRVDWKRVDSTNDSIKVLFYQNKGIILYNKEKFKECIPYFQTTIELYEKLDIKKQSYLNAFLLIGFSYGMMKDYDNAERYYRKALLKSVYAEHNSSFRPIAYRNLGDIYKAKGDSLMAEECYSRMDTADVKSMSFTELSDLEWESECWKRINKLYDTKEYAKAADEYIAFIDGLKEKRGVKDKTYLLVLYSRAILLSRYLDKPVDAIPLFVELTDIGEGLSAVNENVCGAYVNLALCYSRIDDTEKLKDIIRRGQDYLRKANMDEYPPQAVYRFAGNGYYWQGRYADAVGYYEKYIAPGKSNEGGFCYEEIVNMLAVSYIFTDKSEKAKDLLLRLLKTGEGKLKKGDKLLLSMVYHNLGRAYMLCADKANALKYLEKSSEIQVELSGKTTDKTLQYINECQQK